MIENSEQALAYLEAVVAGEIAPENPECREAALIVTRTLRQSTQTLADHAQASGPAEGDGAGVSDEALRRMAEEWVSSVLTNHQGERGYRLDIRQQRGDEPERSLGGWGETVFTERVEDFARRVAEEARREERERIEGIVRGFAHNEHEVPTNHVVLEILRHIKGEER